MKYKYRVVGLDCANCANKIEAKLNACDKIDKASVNFSKETINVVSGNNNIKELVQDIVNSVEPDAKVLDKDETLNNKIKNDIFMVSLGIFLSIIQMFIKNNVVALIIIVLAYAILLYKVLIKAVKLLPKGVIDENLLISISCIGAFLTNNIHEGLMVIVLYDIGKILESIAVNNSRTSIAGLMDLKAEYANVLIDGEYQRVSPEKVKVGDIIRVLQGEKIPLDGIVTKGTAKLDVKSLTGESRLLDVTKDSIVLSGSICSNGMIEVKVTSLYENSTVAKILKLVETAEDRKAKTETFVSKAARIYTPTVLVLAILTVILLPTIFKLSFADSIYRALTFLVISCPCAIAISVPLSYFSGLGRASKEGILIKGSDYLDLLGNVKEIIFDKTGTITTGEFNDYELTILDNNCKRDDIINLIVAGEKLSNHPIAKSLCSLFNNFKGNKHVKDFKEINGMGIEYNLDNKHIKIGNHKFCNVTKKDNAIYINVDEVNVAKIILYDGIKKETKEVINLLKKLNINTKIFTGDSLEYAAIVSKEIGVNEVYAELLPTDKYKLLEEEINKYDNKVAFVGDGINDAPSLARANIGISLGGVGSDSAIEAADMIIMNDDLRKIITGIDISRYTSHIIKENLIFALGTKLLVLILSILGIASMWQAVFADTGVTLLTILNTVRILKRKDK